MKTTSLSYRALTLLLLLASWIVWVLASCHSAKEDLRIMTFNIRYGTADDGENSWPHRQFRCIKVLQKYRPHILGVQEALPFQVEAISSAFPDWQAFGLGRYHGIELSDRPHESFSGESCKVFYDTTKFQLMDRGTFWHSDTPELPGSMSWGNTLPRITTWGMLRMKSNQRMLLVMNTHFHWGEPYVTNATKLLLNRWREIGYDLPTILVGDFNLAPSAWAHQLFCGQVDSVSVKGNFIDVWKALGRSERGAGTFNSFKGDRSGDRIDWILATPHFAFKDIRILHDQVDGKYPSDHFPVMAVVQFK